MFTADRRRVVMFLPFFPKLIAARACTPHFAEYGPRPCVTTLPYGSRPLESRASTVDTPWQSATVRRGPGREPWDGDPSRKGGPPAAALPPSSFDDECGLKDSSPYSARPLNAESGAQLTQRRTQTCSHLPLHRVERTCPTIDVRVRDVGRQRLRKASRRFHPRIPGTPLAPLHAGGLDDWRGRPTKSSGRVPSQLAECQRIGCNGPTIVEVERDSLRG
jgi:hypothetical protein